MICIPKFQFKLQTLLNVKIQMEDSKKNELAKAIRQLESEKAALNSLENKRKEYIDEFKDNSAKGVTVSKLKKYNSFISLLGERISSQKEKVNSAGKIVDKIREELVKIVQERKILEKLREKKYKAFVEEMDRAEQKINDEIVSFKHSNVITGDENGQG